MNYYTLPKNNTKLEFEFRFDTINPPIISHTLIKSLNRIDSHIKNYNSSEVEEISKKINQYQYIFENVCDTSTPISKLKPQSNLYYELYDIFYSCNILDAELSSLLHMGPNYESTFFLLDTIKESTQISKTSINFDCQSIISINPCINSCINSCISLGKKFDLSIFECLNDSDDTQINKLFAALYVICSSTNKNGSVVIKINELCCKATIDTLFMLSNLFDKICLIKPTPSNILTNEKYIVCKNFIGRSELESYTKIIRQIALHIIKKEYPIVSILSNQIPIILLNKIEEFNAIYGQLQLEAKDQLINVINNKNKIDKLEVLKRNNIQKGITWCEKYQIPHNKFSDKVNIFLNFNPADESKTDESQVPFTSKFYS
jgi:hypothetical protein